MQPVWRAGVQNESVFHCFLRSEIDLKLSPGPDLRHSAWDPCLSSTLDELSFQCGVIGRKPGCWCSFSVWDTVRDDWRAEGREFPEDNRSGEIVSAQGLGRTVVTGAFTLCSSDSYCKWCFLYTWQEVRGQMLGSLDWQGRSPSLQGRGGGLWKRLQREAVVQAGWLGLGELALLYLHMQALVSGLWPCTLNI